jgi:hypothetical protein
LEIIYGFHNYITSWLLVTVRVNVLIYIGLTVKPLDSSNSSKSSGILYASPIFHFNLFSLQLASA